MPEPKHPLTASLAHLNRSCIFCFPEQHLQEEQVLLSSDNFYLFAGVGPIVEGLIIIAPRSCDWKKGGLRTISETPTELLDELVFLRGIVFEFYRVAYGFEGGLCFEHGRAGTCGVSDTPHCYHAHLCCFPAAAPIWRDVAIPKRRVQLLAGLHELGATAGRNPYILIQNCEINHAHAPEAAARLSWETRVVVLREEQEIPRQYLRKLLAARAGRGDLWDWAAFPGLRDVASLCAKFKTWLQHNIELPVTWSQARTLPRIDFMQAVRASNSRAYNALAKAYHENWKKPGASMMEAANDLRDFVFSPTTGAGDAPAPRLLDVGCGTAIYTLLFRESGFECAGVDDSEGMLTVARETLQCKKPLTDAPRVQFFQQDAFDFSRFADGAFDAIWCSALLVHLPRRFAPAAMREMRRVLRPGGIIYLSAQAGGDAVLRNERRFFVYYTEPELEAVFHEAGLKVLKRWHDMAFKGSFGDRRAKRWINYFLSPGK